MILFWLSYTTFLLDFFLEARAEILEKISLVFLEDLKTPKGHFEMNWPSMAYMHRIYCSLNYFFHLPNFYFSVIILQHTDDISGETLQQIQNNTDPVVRIERPRPISLNLLVLDYSNVVQ